VKILVGFTPGTAPDLVARSSPPVCGSLGHAFVVENVPGAGSNIATERVAKAAADGYTLLMGGNSALVINPSLFEQLPFDPIKDFAPISQVFIAANVLAVPPEQPVKTVAELVALAKAQPGKLSYGHAGVGTSHLGAELFKYMAHVDVRRCPIAHDGVDAGPARQPVSMSFANIVNVRSREGNCARWPSPRSALGAGARPADHGGIRIPRLEAVPVRPAAGRHAGMFWINCTPNRRSWRCRVRKKFDELASIRSATRRPNLPRSSGKKRPNGQSDQDAGIKLGNSPPSANLEGCRSVTICRATGRGQTGFSGGHLA
jgi:hypothetical protein